MSDPKPPLEIERVYLLDRLPPLPEEAEAFRIEQGYLPDPDDAEPYAEGRVRRKVGPDGAVVCTHTIKRGEGLVREEQERTIPTGEFQRLWERTEGRRIRKIRHTVREGELTWEVDRFLDLPLVMAEVELPSADAEAPLPGWLAPHVRREVTDDPRYRNYALACEGLPST